MLERCDEIGQRRGYPDPPGDEEAVLMLMEQRARVMREGKEAGFHAAIIARCSRFVHLRIG